MGSAQGLDFYSTAAQLIPLLMIVVAFQTRGWARRNWQRYLAAGEFVLCAAALIHSLVFLQTEGANGLGPYLEYAAISVLILTIAGALFPWLFRHEPITRSVFQVESTLDNGELADGEGRAPES